MRETGAEKGSVELTPAEARLVISALQRFEPYWPADLDDLSRSELLTGIREAIDHVVGSLDAPV
jgi:hypothetical protein